MVSVQFALANVGPSVAVGVGNYTGGELWHHDPHGGQLARPCTYNYQGRVAMQAGADVANRCSADDLGSELPEADTYLQFVRNKLDF
jgi:hypothetical protein